MENKEKILSGLTKKQMREAKRELKQIGNQQKRTREKAILRDYVNGDLDDEPDFEVGHTISTEGMNGIDGVPKLKEHWCQEKLDFCRPDGTNEAHQEVIDVTQQEEGVRGDADGLD